MPADSSSTNRQGAALDPVTHFILMPILFVTLGVAVSLAIHESEHRLLHLWFVVVAAGLIVLNVKTRVYALKVQDRVIRLEERLRLAALLPPAELARAQALTVSQLIGLRFASDAELASLVDRTLLEGWSQKQIKDNIKAWRTDTARV